MKTPRLIALTLLATLGSLQAQGGSLTPPPGAPAPVMHSLTELYDKAVAIESQNSSQNTQLTNLQTQVGSVEKRTAVSSLTGDSSCVHHISQPGSYYLTGNLTGAAGKHGIKITANHVTLDLNGFTLTGTLSSTYGVYCIGGSVLIQNGTFTEWTGNDLSGGIGIIGDNVTVEDVSIRSSFMGIYSTGKASIARRCVASQLTNGYGGILLGQNGSAATDCIVRGVTAWGGGTIPGISASVVTGCCVVNMTNVAAGPIIGIEGDTVSGCVVKDISSPGAGVTFIEAQIAENCMVQQDTAPGASSTFCYGIQSTVAQNCCVKKLQTNTTSGTTGIFAVRALNCTVNAVNNSNSGSVDGIESATVAASPTGSPLTYAGVVSGCVVNGIDGTGISIGGMGCVEGNQVGSCTGTGISGFTAIVKNNITNGNATGINLSRGYATGNVSYADTTAFSFGASCRYGPIVTGGGAGGFDSTSNFDQ